MKAIVLKVPPRHHLMALAAVKHFFDLYPDNKDGACEAQGVTFWVRQTKTQLIAETDEFRLAQLKGGDHGTAG